MISINEKKLLFFIRYAPLVVILVTSIILTIIVTDQTEQESKHDIAKIKELYSKHNNIKIKEKVDTVYKYLLNKEMYALINLKQNLKDNVYYAHNIATKIYLNNKNTKTKKEIVELIKFYLNDIRFNDGRGYIFIDDINGKKILQPLNKKLEGKNLINFADANGYKFIQTIVNTIKNKTERFDEYSWYKGSDTSKTFKKIGFYKYFEPYDFAIGSGEYLEDHKANLKKETLTFLESLDSLNSEYVFILDYDGEIISHPNNLYKNKNIFKLENSKSLQFISEFNKILKHNESFVKYEFPFIDEISKEKTSFMKDFNSWKWVIGAGYNDEALDDQIINEKDNVNNIKKERLTTVFSISLVFTISLMLVSLYITKLLEIRFLRYKKNVKKAEDEKVQEILNNARIYEDLFESNKSIILLVNPKNGEILNANKKAISFYGYEKQKLLSMNISEINTLSKEEVTKEIEKAIKNNKEYFNFVHILATGEKRHVEVSTAPSLYCGEEVLFSIIHDVTEKHIINNELQKTEYEFKSLFEFSNIGLAIRDLNGYFTKVNKKLIDMLGYAEKELLHKTCESISSRDKQEEERDLFIKLINKEINNYSIEKKYFRKDGTSFEAVLSMASLTDKNGEITHILSSVIDISEMKRKDNLLYQQSKMAAMGEMIGNIAHQWRQPLSIISTIASGIKMRKEYGQLDEKSLIGSMDDIQNSVNHLSNTIDDFRNFFKPDKEKSYFLINKVVEKALNLITAKLRSEQIELILDISTIEIKSLENELIQVIMNILNNSADAFKNRKGSKYIFIKTTQKDDNLIIKFRDNAGGIDEDTIGRIFEPYFTTKHKSQGTGIGLYMTQEMLIKHMNGTIIVVNQNFIYDNVEYFGAEFVITIPINVIESKE